MTPDAACRHHATSSDPDMSDTDVAAETADRQRTAVALLGGAADVSLAGDGRIVGFATVVAPRDPTLPLLILTPPHAGDDAAVLRDAAAAISGPAMDLEARRRVREATLGLVAMAGDAAWGAPFGPDDEVPVVASTPTSWSDLSLTRESLDVPHGLDPGTVALVAPCAKIVVERREGERRRWWLSPLSVRAVRGDLPSPLDALRAVAASSADLPA